MSTFVYGWIFTNTVITESIAKMSEEVSQHQTLHLIILGLKRYHGLESFYRLRQIPPSLNSAMEHYTVHWPYVVIHYRLGIELYPSYEICRWEMSPTEAGFSVVSKSNLKQCLLKKTSLVLHLSVESYLCLFVKQILPKYFLIQRLRILRCRGALRGLRLLYSTSGFKDWACLEGGVWGGGGKGAARLKGEVEIFFDRI